jgi:hypothetical protein
MNRILLLIALGAAAVVAAPPATNAAVTNRVLIIGPSSMPVAAGRATLTIGALERVDGVYTGDYQIKVSPYFYKNEKGRLNIVVSDESLAKVSDGQVAEIIGTATTAGKGGLTRHIDATATPTNPDRGTLRLWFMAGDRKMIFEPTYHFAGDLPPVPTVQTNVTKHLKRQAPASRRLAHDATPLRP